MNFHEYYVLDYATIIDVFKIALLQIIMLFKCRLIFRNALLKSRAS